MQCKVKYLLLYDALQTVAVGGALCDALSEQGIIGGAQALQQRVEEGEQKHAAVDLLNHNLIMEQSNLIR